MRGRRDYSWVVMGLRADSCLILSLALGKGHVWPTIRALVNMTSNTVAVSGEGRMLTRT